MMGIEVVATPFSSTTLNPAAVLKTMSVQNGNSIA
jgi:hypothetical protein